jgi:hypothetical protein
MAKDVFTAEELGFAPAPQNVFTASDLGLAAPEKQKDIFTAEELFGVPSPKVEAKAEPVETILTPEERMGSPADVAAEVTPTTNLPGQAKPQSEFSPYREFVEKGIPSGVIGLKSMATGVSLITDANLIGSAGKALEVYQAIDEGKITTPNEARQMGLSSDQARIYLNAKSPEAKEQMKLNQQETIAKRQGFVQESINLFKQYQEDAQKVKGVTPDITDVGTVADFGNWLSYNMGSGAVQLAPVMLAAVTTGGWGALGLGTAMGTGEAVNNRMQYIQEKVKSLPPEEQAREIENYIRNTTDTTMAVGLATGFLDMAGPVGAVLRGRAGKEGIKYLTKKEAAIAGVKEIPRSIVEETATGAAQEVVQIGGERYLGEQTGDALSTDNFKRVINAAAAEGAGGAMGGGINVPIKVLQQAQQQAVQDNEDQAYKNAMADVLREKGFVFTKEDAAGVAEEKFVNDILGGDLGDSTSEGNRLTTLIDDFKTKVSEMFSPAENEVTQIEPKPENMDKLVANYELQGMNRDSAVLLANQAIKEAGYGDNVVGGTDQSSVSVSGEQLDTLAGVDAAQRRDMAGASRPVSVAGSGEGTQLGALTPAQIADLSSPESQEVQNNTGTMAHTLFNPNNVRTDGRPGWDTPPAERWPLINAFEMGGKDARSGFSKGAKGYKNKQEKQAYELGLKYATSLIAGSPIDVTPEATSLVESTPVAPVVTKGKRGRKAVEVTPEIAAQKLEIRKQQAGAARDTTRQVAKLEKTLAETFDPSEYTDMEAAADDLNQYQERQRQAVEDLYKVSTGPQKNNTAGKKAQALLANIPPQQIEIAKQRIAAKKKVQEGTARSDVLEGVDQSVIRDSTNGQDNIKYTEWNSSTAALSWIAKKGNAFEKVLAKRLMPFLKGVKIVVVDNLNEVPADRRDRFNGAAGMYYEVGNERVIYLSSDGGINNTVFLHEALHGATLMRIKNYLRAKKRGAKVDPTMQEAMADLVDVMRRSKEFYAALKVGQDRGLITDPAQLRLIKIAGVFNNSDAFDDPAEFVAYGMTHPAFQEFLRVVPGREYGEKSTIIRIKDGLTQFVQSIRKMFGMEEGYSSALQDLIIVSDKVLRAKPVEQNATVGLPASALAKKEKVDKILQKIQRGEYSDEVGGLLGELIELRSWDQAKDLFKTSYKTLNSKSIKGLMPVLTTMQIIDWIGDKIPHLSQVTRLTEKMSVMRSKMLARVKDLSDPWLDFAKKYDKGAKDLARLMHYTTLADVDPTAHRTVDAAIKNDKVLAQLNQKFQQAAPASRPSIKGQITTRTKRIQLTYRIWDRLGKYGKGEGHKIYADIKQHYKNIFDLHRAILDDRIAQLKLPGDINDASTPKGRLMSAIRASYEGSKMIDVYFPLMRYGQYWASIGKGQGREFYMFESEFQRNNFIKKRLRQMQAEGEQRDEATLRADLELDSGDDLAKLRQLSTENSQLLTNIFEAIDTTGTADKDVLKDAVYQMYLLTMPEQSFRSQFVHRKGTAGFTGDALRNFVKSGYSSAGQLSTLKYAPEINQEIDSADDALLGNPDKERLEIFTREIRKRIKDEINPHIEDEFAQRFANGVGHAAFIMFLTAPKSALANMTAIPIFGMPVLASRYGNVNAARTLASYAKVWNHTTAFKPDGTYTPLSIGFSKHVRTNPVLQAAFDEAAERGITEITRTYDLLAMAKTPSTKFTGGVSRFYRGAITGLGALFHHSERLNREIMYMASFELAYNKAVKDGLAPGVNNEAFQRAVDESVKNTYDSMFNYTKFNRPRVMRPWGARIVLQFKLFPQQVTAYLVRNFYGIWKGMYNTAKNIQDPVERTQALRELNEAGTQFFGTLIMTGLFAGVVGMPLYSAIIGTIQGIRDAMQDEDDPIPIDERDLDYWFRYVFLPKYFGDGMARTIQKGPLSVMSNLDIGSSTSLDNLWFRDTQNDKSLITDFRNQIVGMLGPSAAMVENFIKAYEDWNNGNVSQAVEKIVPAAFKGMVTATRWGEEGIVTKTQKGEIYSQQEVTTAARFWKLFGFNPTELAIQQDKNFKSIEQINKVKEERAEVVSQVKNASLQGDYNKLDKEIQNLVRFAIKNPDTEIDVADVVINAIEGAEKARAEAINGVVVTDEKLRARAYMLLNNLPKRPL